MACKCCSCIAAAAWLKTNQALLTADGILCCKQLWDLLKGTAAPETRQQAAAGRKSWARALQKKRMLPWCTHTLSHVLLAGFVDAAQCRPGKQNSPVAALALIATRAHLLLQAAANSSTKTARYASASAGKQKLIWGPPTTQLHTAAWACPSVRLTAAVLSNAEHTQGCRGRYGVCCKWNWLPSSSPP